MVGLGALRLVVETGLERLNEGWARRRKGDESEKEAQVLAYTMAKSRMAILEAWGSMLAVLGLLIFGFFPWWKTLVEHVLGTGFWAQSAFVVTGWQIVAMTQWPLEDAAVRFGGPIRF